MSQDLLVRMTALGHLVFILACVSFAHSALIVPFWQPLPEVQRQRQHHREKVAEPEQPEEDDYPEEDLENTMIASGPLCVWRFGHSSCMDSEVARFYDSKGARFFNSERASSLLRLF